LRILSIEHLNIDYLTGGRTVHAVNDVSLSVEKGESMGIVGESGSGKSTLAMGVLRLLNKRITRISGAAVFKEQDDLISISDQRLRALRWTELAVVFQKSMNALSPVHRIGTQMCDMYRVHDASLDKKDLREKMAGLLALVGLGSRVLDAYPHELSGGMMQRVCVAISLMHNPSMLILDEATTALDVVTQTQILREIMELEERFDLTRIMITHDISVVASSCAAIAVMYAGKMMESGRTRDVLKTPLHPYTQGLLASYPTLFGGFGKLRGIPGTLPSMTGDLQGCLFAPRCPHAMAICSERQPDYVRCGEGRYVACHLIGGISRVQ